MLGHLPIPPIDPIMTINAAFREDKAANKIDLGIGVFRDASGETPIYRAVKAAETWLVEQQKTKTYVSPAGDLTFVQRAGDLIFTGKTLRQDYAGVQTAGGTGAVRLAVEVAARSDCGTVWIPNPSWGNHKAIAKIANMNMRFYRHHAFRLTGSAEVALEDLAEAKPGDAIILHGCCQNPTGVDYSESERAMIVEFVRERGLLPIVDLAYLGFGKGLEEDKAFTTDVLASCPEVLIAMSFSKNMGLYRDRVGACFVVSGDAKTVGVAQSTLASLARSMYSMPPDHGAAVASHILGDAALRADWLSELSGQRGHILENRQKLCRALAEAGVELDTGYISGGAGMFCLLPLSEEAIVGLRENESLYLGPAARVNLAAIRDVTLPRVAELLAAVLPATAA